MTHHPADPAPVPAGNAGSQTELAAATVAVSTSSLHPSIALYSLVGLLYELGREQSTLLYLYTSSKISQHKTEDKHASPADIYMIMISGYAVY